MMCNVGKIDRIVRLLAGVVLISVALLFVPTTIPKVLLLGVALLFWASAWYGVCYIYRIIGISSHKTPPSPVEQPQS